MQNYISTSLNETEEISKIIAKKIKKGNVIAFSGGMGYGKTTFIKSLIKNLGSLEMVTSPTFNIVNEYMCSEFKAYHFDMFRINNEDDLYSVGFYDYLNQDNLIIIEWSENILESLPKNCIKINIEKTSESVRTFTVSGMN